MKKLLLAVSVFALIAPDIALAQQQSDQPRTRGDAQRPAPVGGQPGGGQARPQRPGGGQPGQPGRPGNGGPQVQPGRPGAGGPQIQPQRPGGGGQPGRPGNGGPQIQPPRPGNGGPGNGGPGHGGPQIQPPRPGNGGPGYGGPGNGNRPQPGRPGNGYNSGNPHRPGAGRPPNFRPIRGPSFRYPRGYGYRRWSIGSLLPGLFLSNSYYYNNYDALGVGPPPPGYRWVRYGPDLLLVQRGSGRVADVIYGAFY
jgi:Ni/Co efflux regulator RcnB